METLGKEYSTEILIARRLNQISFSSLMEVYLEGNLEKSAEEWKHLPRQFALQQAEQDFYLYLRDVFFKLQNTSYVILRDQTRYISALRLEPYQDGLLLEALETRPDSRRHGYARKLIISVLTSCSGIKIYSHVDKRNIASLKTHEACGFKKIMDHAVYVDGSVNHRACTLLHE